MAILPKLPHERPLSLEEATERIRNLEARLETVRPSVKAMFEERERPSSILQEIAALKENWQHKLQRVDNAIFDLRKQFEIFRHSCTDVVSFVIEPNGMLQVCYTSKEWAHIHRVECSGVDSLLFRELVVGNRVLPTHPKNGYQGEPFPLPPTSILKARFESVPVSKAYLNPSKGFLIVHYLPGYEINSSYPASMLGMGRDRF